MADEQLFIFLPPCFFNLSFGVFARARNEYRKMNLYSVGKLPLELEPDLLHLLDRRKSVYSSFFLSFFLPNHNGSGSSHIPYEACADAMPITPTSTTILPCLLAAIHYHHFPPTRCPPPTALAPILPPRSHATLIADHPSKTLPRVLVLAETVKHRSYPRSRSFGKDEKRADYD